MAAARAKLPPLKSLSEEELGAFVAARPGSVRARALWAAAALKREDPQLALARVDAFVSTGADDDLTPLHMVRFDVLRATDDEEAAERFLAGLIERGDAALPVWVAWARCAAQRKDYQAAAARYEEGAARHPEAVTKQWQVLRIRALINADRADDARRLIAAVFRDEREDCRSRLGVGERTLDAFCLVAVTVGDRFSSAIMAAFMACAARYGELAAIQHVRNLLYACCNKVGPPTLMDVLADGVRAADIGGLRFPMRLLDDELFARGVHDLPVVPGPASGRALVIVSYIPSLMFGPHQRFVSSFATALALSGAVDGVDVLITNELQPEGPRVQDGPLDEQRRAEWEKDVAAMAGDRVADVRLHATEQSGPVHPQAESIATALALRPSVLICIEGIYGSVTIGPAIARTVPTLALPTGSFLPEPRHADLILAHGNPISFADKPTPDKWTLHHLPVIVLDRESDIRDETIPTDTPVRIVSAISGGRMDKALRHAKGDLARRIDALLGTSDTVGWTLIGLKDPAAARDLVPAWRDRPSERVRFHDVIANFRTNLAGFDIFFHPESETGGAMGVAMAIAEGVAVIAPRACDAANFLPTEWLYDTSDEGFALLARLVADATLRQTVATAQLRQLERHTVLRVAAELPGHVARANARFQQREG